MTIIIAYKTYFFEHVISRKFHNKLISFKKKLIILIELFFNKCVVIIKLQIITAQMPHTLHYTIP